MATTGEPDGRTVADTDARTDRHGGHGHDFEEDEISPMTTETVFWGRDDDEILRHIDANEAIEEIIDGYHPDPISKIGEVAVYEYKPMKPTLSSHCSPLEMVLEILDEEYGNPDGDDIAVTDAMKEAEQAFIKAVLAEYKPWACEQTGKVVTVDALEWARKHRPDWLKPR